MSKLSKGLKDNILCIIEITFRFLYLVKEIK